MRTIPRSVRITELEACRDELAERAKRHEQRVGPTGDPALQPSLGREIDRIRSRLARARSELARMRAAH